MSKTTFSKVDERVLSDFSADRFIYLYLTGQLEADRSKFFELKMSESEALKKQVSEFQNTLNSLSELQELNISDVGIKKISEPSTFLWMLLIKFKIHEWPRSYRMIAETLAVAIISVIIILIVPWTHVFELKNKMSSGVVQLAEITRKEYADPDAQVQPDPPVVENTTKSADIALNQPPEQESKAKSNPEPAVLDTKESKLVAIDKAKSEKNSAIPAENNNKQAEQKGIVLSAAEKSKAKKQGYLFRGRISVENAEEVSQKLASFILTNGGGKAGEVELGWKKGRSYYFHFTLPEAEFKKVEDYFNSFGKLQISKEPHPRVMPDGISRLIILVDEKK